MFLAGTGAKPAGEFAVETRGLPVGAWVLDPAKCRDVGRRHAQSGDLIGGALAGRARHDHAESIAGRVVLENVCVMVQCHVDA